MKTVLSAALTLAVAGHAAAQIARPPVGPREPLPPYTPAQPVEPQIEEPTEIPEDLYADVEYESIAKRDAEGNFIRHRRPTLTALRATPVLTEDLWEIIDDVLNQRAERMRQTVANNPQQVLDLKAGRINQLDISTPETVTAVIGITQPLSPEKPLLLDLLEIGLIDKPTAALTGRIYSEYQQALFVSIDEDFADAGPEAMVASQSQKAIAMLNEQMGEALDAFDQLAKAIAANPGAVFESAGVDMPAGADLQGVPAEEAPARVAKMLEGMPVQDAGAVLRAAGNMVGNG